MSASIDRWPLAFYRYTFCVGTSTLVSMLFKSAMCINRGFIQMLMAAGYVGVAVQDQDEQIVDEISQIAHEYIKVHMLLAMKRESSMSILGAHRLGLTGPHRA